MAVKIALLGPGYPAEQIAIRKETQKILEENGIEVIIMEDLGLDEGAPLHEMFHKMLDEHDPDMVVAFYTARGFSNAVDFELGSLTCRDSPKLKHVVIMIEIGVDEKTITSYITRGLTAYSDGYMFENAQNAASKILNCAKRIGLNE